MLSLVVCTDRDTSKTRVLSPDQLNPMAGHVAVALDKLMLIWGGYYVTEQGGERFTSPNELLVYDSVMNKWFCFTTSGDIPHETTGACGVLVEKTLYVFGGFCDDPDHFAKLYALDLPTLVWRNVKPAEWSAVPSVRHKLVGWHYKNKLYFFGGFGPPPVAVPLENGSVKYLQSSSSRFIYDANQFFTNSWNNQLISFDLDTLTYDLVPLLGDPPSSRAAHSATFVPDTTKVIIFGGRLLEHRMNDMYMLDLPSMIWTKLETNEGPCGRSWHTAVAIDANHVLLFGGFSQDCVPLRDAWLFSIDQRHWTRLDRNDIEKPRLWHTAVSIGESCYVYGGCTSNVFNINAQREFANDLMIINASPKSLAQLCLNQAGEKKRWHEKRHALLPAPLYDKLQFISSSTKQKSVKTPIELLRL